MKALKKWLKGRWHYHFKMSKEAKGRIRHHRQAIDDIARVMISRMDPNYHSRFERMSVEELQAENARLQRRQKELQWELQAIKAKGRECDAKAAEYRAETRRLKRLRAEGEKVKEA